MPTGNVGSDSFAVRSYVRTSHYLAEVWSKNIEFNAMVEFKATEGLDVEQFNACKRYYSNWAWGAISKPMDSTLDVTFDRKIKRSNLDVAISRPRLSTCSYIQWVPVPPKLLYRLRTGRRSDAATYCEPANSTKSHRIDPGIYPDKANWLSIPGRTLVRWLFLPLRLDRRVRGGRLIVQRLLQPTRELVKSEFEARVESQGSVITRWLGKNKLS